MTVPAGLVSDLAMDRRDPRARLAALLDPGSLSPIHDGDGGVVSARGTAQGTAVIAFATDATRMGGALGTAGCRAIVQAIDLAVAEGVPVAGLWHSGGARLGEGVEALDAVGRVFAAMVRASGKVPQISVVLGPAAGGAAYGPALTDLVIMAPAARVFVTGPDVVRSVTGEDVDMETLGGPGVHGTRSGVTHVVAADDDDALAQARRLLNLLGDQGSLDAMSAADDRDLSRLLPGNPRRAYDIRPLVTELLDGPPVHLQAKWARNVVTAVGRLAGRTVGVLANNPLHTGGCLDATSAEKAARFVRMCDSLGVPLIVLVDVPGYLPGTNQEHGGVVRRGAKLLHAFAEATVPRITLVVRKAYGGAYIAMNSRSLGATAVFAWPDAEVAVMGAEAAVDILSRKVLAAAPEEERAELKARLVAEHERAAGGLGRALALGAVDEVVEPAGTRFRLALELSEALAADPGRRGRHGNIPL
ncbi:acyl-CoA carboxylase subunit beta [Microbispora bryophytorum]|uniref:acyl-CoA carboxylase subunit beta n=1 Tax=Microbispora bryophytorum TaxID=1460882 RepID=UPI0037205F62